MMRQLVHDSSPFLTFFLVFALLTSSAQAPAFEFYPLAPGSVVTAGSGGFLLEPGSMPEEKIYKGMEGSTGFVATGGRKVVPKGALPPEVKVRINATGCSLAPTIMDFTAGDNIGITFDLSNEANEPVRFASREIGKGHLVLISGDEAEVPVPTAEAPYIWLSEKLVFKITEESKFDYFFVEIKPGKSVKVTVTEQVLATGKDVQLLCGSKSSLRSFVVRHE